jgi:hypothetical protein
MIFLTSLAFKIPDNEDGSQWFHLLNEEFTEKLLKELADEYKSVYTDKCSTQFKQRFEQIRQQKVNKLLSISLNFYRQILVYFRSSILNNTSQSRVNCAKGKII